MYGFWIFTGAAVIAVVAIVVTMLEGDVHSSAAAVYGMRDQAVAPPQDRLNGSAETDMGTQSMVTGKTNVEMDAITIFTAVNLTEAVAKEVTGFDEDGGHPAVSSAIRHDMRDRAAVQPTDATSIVAAVSVIAAVAMAATRNRQR